MFPRAARDWDCIRCEGAEGFDSRSSVLPRLRAKSLTTGAAPHIVNQTAAKETLQWS